MHGLRYLLDTNILCALIRQPQGAVAATLARRGYGTACTSIVVAAHALALGLTLVTDNASEFTRIPRLRVENWLDAQATGAE